MKKLAAIFQSKEFKLISLVLSILVWIFTLTLSFNPDTFLKFGYPGIFVFNVVGGVGTFLVPILSRKLNLFLLAAVTALGMAFNDSIAYVVGRSGTVLLSENRKTEKVKESINKYGVVGLFFWSLIPIPYDFIGLVAGLLEFPYKKFLGASFAGKLVRFLLLGAGVNLFIRLL